MIARKFVSSISLFLAVTCSAIDAYADTLRFDYFSSENIKKFATYLVTESDYLRAGNEYMRLLSIPDFNKDTLNYQIALCFEKADSKERAIARYKRLTKGGTSQALFERSRYRLAWNYHSLSQFDLCDSMINASTPEIEDPAIVHNLELLRGINYIKQGKWGPAQQYLGRLEERNPAGASANPVFILRNYAAGKDQLPVKSPHLSAALSAVCPGLGKIYCGQKGDGFYSLIICAATGYLSWHSYEKRGLHSAGTLFLSATALYFYLGNVYGSIFTAKRFNQDQIDKYRNSLPHLLKEYDEFPM